MCNLNNRKGFDIVGYVTKVSVYIASIITNIHAVYYKKYMCTCLSNVYVQVTESCAGTPVPIAVACSLLLSSHKQSGWCDAHRTAAYCPLHWRGHPQS